MSRQRRTKVRTACVSFFAGLLCLFAALAPGYASAAEPPPLFAEFQGKPVGGEGAGDLTFPKGVAVDPVSHRIYVADTNNRRISVFTPWGEFVRAIGWGVRDGSSELQTCTTATGCRKGLSGSGPGQFGQDPARGDSIGPTGIGVDSSGNVYAMDPANLRVQKFDSDGNFLLTIGGKVNATTGGNLCTAASGDTCVAGQAGGGPGEFSLDTVNFLHAYTLDYLDVGADGRVYVGDKGRIERFAPDGSFQSSLTLAESAYVGELSIDPKSGDIYFVYANGAANGPGEVDDEGRVDYPDVHRLDPDTGAEIGPPLRVNIPGAVAADSNGHVFAFDQRAPGNDAEPGNHTNRILEFDEKGQQVSILVENEFNQLFFSDPALAANTVTKTGGIDLYVAYVSGSEMKFKVYGATPDPAVAGPPPKVAPQIEAQFASSVDSDGAVLGAEINPLFWGDTTYYLEYGTVPCATGPCSSVPAAPGSKLTTRTTNELVKSAGIFLGGLAPNTTYYYRFVAQSGGSEGQPVRGVGGKVGVDGTEGTFTTRPSSEAVAPCANDSFRLDAAASLPDCRAYEMVSPVDKNNADVATLTNLGYELQARSDRSSGDGERLTYSAYKAFGDAIASAYSVQYLVSRSPQGWIGKSISPPREGATLKGSAALDTQFKEGFSEDLCSGWFYQDTDLSLAPEAVPGFVNLYKGDFCGGGGYEAITRVTPPERAPDQYAFEVQGSSADGVHTVFRANDKLTANAPGGNAETPKVYDYFEGNLRLVCVLPNKTAVAGCSAGTAKGAIPAENAGSSSLHNAVSDDGLRIYWTAASGGPGKLYLRSNTVETIAVSKGGAVFLGAAADGSRVIYREAGQLFEFDAEEDAPEGGNMIAGGLVPNTGGVVGMSEDATKVYFVSKEDLDGGGAAVAGEPNLYLHDEGGFTFIATLAGDDLEAQLSPTSPEPFRHAARVTPDGETLAFISSNELTGQDSTDANSGKADSQVYLWDARDQLLRCVSCNRTGARPIGADANVHLSYVKGPFWAAGLLPTTESQLYAPRALSEDGERIFFESFDKLVTRDTNGTLDVYEWEADGKGGCREAEGCVELISSGQSPERSEFVDADPSGKNVFFTTNASLLPQDLGLIDIYDARVDGGFPLPPGPPAACEGEACQGPFNPPNDPTPGSLSFNGAGNVKEPTTKPRCAKGKTGSKGRCVAKKPKQSKTKAKKAKKANHNRRAGR